MKPGVLLVPLLSLSATCVQAFDGVLSYDNEDTVIVGRLDTESNNQLSEVARLQHKGEADIIHYAVDRSGTLVGTCRTKRFQPFTAMQEEVMGDMDISFFEITGRQIGAVGLMDLLRKLDGSFGTRLRTSVDNDRSRYMHCYQMGAANRNSRVVFYLKPEGYEDNSNHFAVEMQMRGKTFSITDFEIFEEGAAPSRVIARENPLKGNTVDIVNKLIQVNGSPVLRNGNALAADSVKHRFK